MPMGGAMADSGTQAEAAAKMFVDVQAVGLRLVRAALLRDEPALTAEVQTLAANGFSTMQSRAPPSATSPAT
jgi:hypothetical protein